MPVEIDSKCLLSRFEQGEPHAADAIFHRYVDRLIALSCSFLADHLRRRVDAEDVVQSVYRSFFRHAVNHRYALDESGDLWRLLAAITVNKTRKTARFHSQAKRAIQRERATPEEWHISLEELHLFSKGPQAADVVAVMDELEDITSQLEPRHRDMLELRLQGYDLDVIAQQVDCSQRTVRRVLSNIHEQLDRRLQGRMH